MSLRMLSNYQSEDLLRKSLSALASDTFGINLEGFYDAGYWTDSYTPYSIADGNRIVANVSANDMHLLWHGQRVHALQLGTIMTAPDYRGQGLSRRLIEHILETLESSYEFIYLFANDSVLDFYPRFGFVPCPETETSLDLNQPLPGGYPLRPLDRSSPADHAILSRLADSAIPVSPVLSTVRNPYLARFYLNLSAPELAFYLEQEDAILVLEQDGDAVRLLDLLADHPVDLLRVIASVKQAHTRLSFGFTPDLSGSGLLSEESVKSAELFMRPAAFDGNFCFPFLSKA